MAYSSHLEQAGLRSARGLPPSRARRDDLRPALHERVVGQRLLRPLLALAERVEPVGQLAGDLGLAAELASPARPPRSRRSLRARGSGGGPSPTRSAACPSPGPSRRAAPSGRSSRTLPRLRRDDAGLDHARRRSCSWPSRASRQRRTRPRRSRTARTTPAPSGVSASKSPSCSASTSSSVWLMSASASRTVSGLPVGVEHLARSG